MTFTFFSCVRGGPGEIRGRQMAHHLGGKFNPVEGYENDCCVYVIGTGPENGREQALSYHDVMDCGWGRIARVRRLTHGGIIAFSNTHRDSLAEALPGRDIHLIPQHHCNFLRETIPERPVLRVGCIGGDSAVQWPHYAVKRMVTALGLEWEYGYHYARRWRVVEYYKTIDIQLSFRPTHARSIPLHMNCLKLANAGSFGIPTVAFPEPAYVAEWKDECLWGDGMEAIMWQIKRLKDDAVLYKEMAARAKAKAEAYHIEKISELYRALPGASSG
jgi:hypothetical protein